MLLHVSILLVHCLCVYLYLIKKRLKHEYAMAYLSHNIIKCNKLYIWTCPKVYKNYSLLPVILMCTSPNYLGKRLIINKFYFTQNCQHLALFPGVVAKNLMAVR